jgi:hypothetical protein
VKITFKVKGTTRATVQEVTERDYTLSELRRLWEAEQTLNELTPLRVHINEEN